MYPYFRSGDVIYIEKVPFQDLKPGEVIVFRREDRWVAHRYIKRKDSDSHAVITTRGDACLRYDEAVSEANYVGKVVMRKRKDTAISLSGAENYSRIVMFLQPFIHYPLFGAAICVRALKKIRRLVTGLLSSSN